MSDSVAVIEKRLWELVERSEEELQGVQLGEPEQLSLSNAQKQDVELSDELKELKRVWVLATLLKEIEVNMELGEYENVLHSLRSLHEKISALETDNSKLLSIYEALTARVNEHIQLVWDQFWTIGEDRITFNSAATTQRSEQYQYSDIYEIISNNSDLLKIKNTDIPAVITGLVAKLDNVMFELDGNTLAYQKKQLRFIENITSVENLVNFISLVPNYDVQILKLIDTKIYNHIKTVTYRNITEIYKNEALKSSLISLDEFLGLKNFKKVPIKNWINEFNEILIENYVNISIDKIRKLFDLKFEITEKNISSFTDSNEIKNEKAKDDWDWKDDEWDEDEDQEDDGWDNDNDDDEWDEWETTKKPEPVKTAKPGKKVDSVDNMIKCTEIPIELNKIISSFNSNSSSLPAEQQEYYLSKINYLITTIIMLSTDYYGTHYETPLILYNDLLILNKLSQLDKVRQMNDSMLIKFIKASKSEIFQKFNEFNLLDMNYETSSALITKNIGLLENDINAFFQKLTVLPLEISKNLEYQIINDFYELIITKILNKFEISELQSLNLNKIIKLLLNMRFLNINPATESNKIPSISRLSNINFILINHLVDIMNKFYNSDFFDLRTEEIISLLNKLFSDSEKKTFYIKEIREIREAI